MDQVVRLARKRLHRVNPALVAHAVPLLGCERVPIGIAAGLAAVPAVGTGIVHWQPDLFGVLVFVPLWGLARLAYIYDPRSAAKAIEHCSWLFERYVPRTPLGRSLKPRRPNPFSRLTRVITRAVTS